MKKEIQCVARINYKSILLAFVHISIVGDIGIGYLLFYIGLSFLTEINNLLGSDKKDY